MADAIHLDAWDRAVLIALPIYNALRDSRNFPRPFQVSDLHPYRQDTDMEIEEDSVEEEDEETEEFRKAMHLRKAYLLPEHIRDAVLKRNE